MGAASPMICKVCRIELKKGDYSPANRDRYSNEQWNHVESICPRCLIEWERANFALERQDWVNKREKEIEEARLINRIRRFICGDCRR